MSKNYCIDCDKEISPKAKRCQSCYLSFCNPLKISGQKHPRYDKGQSKKGYFKCIKCNKPIHYTTWNYGSKMCHSCSSKGERNTNYESFGDKNTNFKDGRTLKKHYCKNCKREILFQTACYGTGFCFKCVIDIKDYSKMPRGKDSWNWNNGSSLINYPAEFTKKLKLKIQKRDNHTCQYCGMTKEEHFEKYKRDIEVHHIDSCTLNCKENNLITLCKKDNMKANKDRDYWYAYYKYVMEEKL